jgi:short-subunit dehydrogenase
MTADAPLVFITGASSGIGQALALRYYQAGYRLALVARRAELMAQWAQDAHLDASRYGIYCADVSSIDSIVNAGAQCLAQQGLPAVVIANAGISVGVDTAYRADLDAMAQLFATNNIGLAASFHPFIEPMRVRGSGVLVGIASVAGIRGLPGHGAYCASKAAVISYCESLRGELRGTGVRVLTLSPGYIDTPLTRKNKYPMPFLMSAAAFADKAFRAIGSNATYRVIPWQMGWVAKLLRLLPNRLFDSLLAGQPRKHRTPQ